MSTAKEQTGGERAERRRAKPIPRVLTKRRKARPLTREDGLFEIVGIGESKVPGGIAGRKHEFGY